MQAFSSSFQLAADFIHYSNRSVFLTGKAGTGKTTFLKHIREQMVKQVAVLAPTGVAAINAGGTTIHSFFQLPFTPFVPEQTGFRGNDHMTDKHSLIGRIKMNSERRSILQQLELLIIDEVSMVRCDVMDAIDVVLRHFRNRHNEPFGGVQLLLIGDLFQLSPVVPEEEWNLLSRFYGSPYFFDSRAIKQKQPVYIELDKIYRQSDELFIGLLNKVRNNELDPDGFRLLQKHHKPSFQPSKEDGYITLTTHNYKADAINTERLAALPGKLFLYKAAISREFNEKSYPADETLQLKNGAQVMFIKNDSEKIRRYYNGKIGVVEEIKEDKILVRCKDEETVIEVNKETWKNIRYTINKTTQQVEEDEVGSFTQYPLRLAWAITIHKSQGLTFEKAVIDAGAAFAAGQVYVALSRCTSLDGLVLLSHINSNSLHTDERITVFSKNKTITEQLPQELEYAKVEYGESVLLSLFNYDQAIKLVKDLIVFVEEHSESFNSETLPWLEELRTKINAIQQVAQKFQSHIKQLSAPDQNNLLQERIRAAYVYFSEQLTALLQFIYTSPAVTDSRQYSLSYNGDLGDLHTFLAQKFHIKNGCISGFNIEVYHQLKNNFILPPFTVNAYAGASVYKRVDSPHPVLHRQLRELRDQLCRTDDLPIYIVAGSTTLDEMARYLPQTLQELSKVSGFGAVKIKKYGQVFLDPIIKYAEEKGLSSAIHEKIQKRDQKEKLPVKTDTKNTTYKLFREGKTMAEIATERNLTVSTIEGHLGYFIGSGEIQIEELLNPEKLLLIESALVNFEGNSITAVKQQLGDDISFGEIRLMLAAKTFKKNNKQ